MGANVVDSLLYHTFCSKGQAAPQTPAALDSTVALAAPLVAAPQAAAAPDGMIAPMAARRALDAAFETAPPVGQLTPAVQAPAPWSAVTVQGAAAAPAKHSAAIIAGATQLSAPFDQPAQIAPVQMVANSTDGAATRPIGSDEVAAQQELRTQQQQELKNAKEAQLAQAQLAQAQQAQAQQADAEAQKMLWAQQQQQPQQQQQQAQQQQQEQPKMKCVDAAGAAVWCSDVNAVVPGQQQQAQPSPAAAMKCVDATGTAVWCSDINAVPSPEPSPAAAFEQAEAAAAAAAAAAVAANAVVDQAEEAARELLHERRPSEIEGPMEGVAEEQEQAEQPTNFPANGGMDQTVLPPYVPPSELVPPWSDDLHAVPAPASLVAETPPQPQPQAQQAQPSAQQAEAVMLVKQA